MFKKITLLFCALFLGFMSIAQKADWEKMPVSYTQLPSKPVIPMAKKYSVEVVMDSENLVKNMTDERTALVESITKTNALLAKQGKAPQYFPADNNYYPVNRDMQAVKSGTKLDGCQEVSSGQEFAVKLNVSGFNVVGTKLVEKSETVNGVSKKSYTYEVSYVYKIAYQVLDATGTVIREEIVKDSETPIKKSTQSFETAYLLESWWGATTSKSPFLTQCDNDAYAKSMKAAKKQLNDELGYPVRVFKLDVATNKDAAYTDLQTAFSEASMGYNYLSTDKAKAVEYLQKAVTIWEKALAESDLVTKKARINENITGALYANLAVAYCFLENWEKCNHSLVKLKSMDKGGALKNKLEEDELFKNDYEARIRANAVQ